MAKKAVSGGFIFGCSAIFFAFFSFLAGSVVKVAHPRLTLTAEVVIVLLLFFSIYFYLMWIDIYSKSYHYYLRNSYHYVIKNTALSMVVVVTICFLFSQVKHSVSIVTLAFYCLTGTLSFLLMHLSQYVWIRYLSRLGYFQKNVLVIGNPDVRFPIVGYFQDIGNTRKYIGTIGFEADRWFFRSRGTQKRYIQGLGEIKEILFTSYTGHILFFLGQQLQGDLLLSLVTLCRSLQISYYMVPDISHLPHQNPWNKLFPHIPVLEAFTVKRESLMAISAKRIIDLALSLIGLLMFLPFGLLIAIAIVAEDGGPVFYTHPRVGKGGNLINFIKFRTMLVNADKHKEKLLVHNVRTDGPLFKMKNDPRVTKVGKVLRKLNIDEVPQLLNVLLGQLSLVGPRPHLPEEVQAYTGLDYLRLECIPGVVGLPQVHGRRYTLGFREWVDMDLKYRANWSLKLDLSIIGKTVKILLANFLIPHKYIY